MTNFSLILKHNGWQLAARLRRVGHIALLYCALNYQIPCLGNLGQTKVAFKLAMSL